MGPAAAGFAETGIEQDADHEEEVDLVQAPATLAHNGQQLDAEGSDLDAEGEDDEEADEEDDAVIASSSDARSDSNGDGESDTSESEEANEWQDESDGGDERETGVVDSNHCIFCREAEEDDPSEEFEEYLACAVCGDNAHRQCARDAKCLTADEDAERWRCKSCIDNGLEPDGADQRRSSSRKRSPIPKVARELLASHRGAPRPGEHSVFNNLILEDDPMDGSRSLRKRKASLEEEMPQRPSRKRQRASEAASLSNGADLSTAESSPARSRRTDFEAALRGQHESTTDDAPSTRPRPGRLRPSRKAEKPLAHVVSAEGISLIVSFNLNSEKMQKILGSRPKKKGSASNRERSRKKIAPPVLVEPEPSHYPPLPTSYNAAMLFALGDRDEDPKAKPYGGILSEAEADTSKTFPQPIDRKKFEDARLKAEEDWKKKMALRNTLPEPTRPSQKMSGPPSKIKCINFGGYEIDTWHAAPYPEEYSRNKILYICEFCLKYMNSDYVAWRHKLKCPAKHPPGDEIYRDRKYSFFEIDGRKNPVYCQNLCLLAKLFLGSKTLYYDVEPFLFYVMTENDDMGCHFVGYFSKEKRPSSLNNVSCILVLPIFQRRGFGHMLIEFSYLLTRVEKKTGSPEKPLSDMGLVSYRGYWRLIMCYQLRNRTEPLSIQDLSEQTGMTPDDIVSALEALRALVRDPVTKTYALRIDQKYYNEYIEKYESKNYPRIDPERLVWVPYVMNRGLERHFEEAGAVHTVAQRETDADAAADEEATQDDEDEDVKAKTPLPNGDVPMPDAPTPTDPAAGSRLTPPRSPPTTPLANGHSTTLTAGSATIPPSRFEVFPPVPGTAKRRPGRPFGSRTRNRTMTPVARSASGLANGFPAATPVTATRVPAALAERTASPAVNGASGRRTRSMAGGGAAADVEMLNGKGESEHDGDPDEDAEGDVEAEHGDAGPNGDVAGENGVDLQTAEDDDEADAEGEDEE